VKSSLTSLLQWEPLQLNIPPSISQALMPEKDQVTQWQEATRNPDAPQAQQLPQLPPPALGFHCKSGYEVLESQ